MTRWSPRGTAWRSQPSPRSAPYSTVPTSSTQLATRADLLLRRARGRRRSCDVCRATVSSAIRQACLRTTRTSPRDLLALYCVTGEPAVVLPPQPVHSSHHRSDFADGKGGLFDTSHDAERLVQRPQDPTDNATPSGQSAAAGALLSYAALSGDADSGRRRAAHDIHRSARIDFAAIRRLVACGRRGMARRTARSRDRRWLTRAAASAA